jgi:acyl-CoA thioesterase-2
MRRLEAVQEGEPVFAMMCSFTPDTEGYEYELPIDRDVPAPDELPVSTGPGPWSAAHLGPTPPAPDGTRSSTHRAWSRIPVALPDDPHLHAALIAFVTDITGTGGRPLHLEGDVTGMVSIDHAAWFHRPLRADEWLFYDVHSLVNTGGRSSRRRLRCPGDAAATRRDVTGMSYSSAARALAKSSAAKTRRVLVARYARVMFTPASPSLRLT